MHTFILSHTWSYHKVYIIPLSESRTEYMLLLLERLAFVCCMWI